jgi:hypothetical protein
MINPKKQKPSLVSWCLGGENYFFSMGMRLRFLSILLTVGVLAGGCAPAVLIVPSYIQSVGVATVINQTSEYGIDTLFTNQFIQDFQIDGRLPIENPDRADLVVNVTVKKYDEIPVLFDPKTNFVLQYRITLTYDMSAIDKKENKTLVEDKDKIHSYFYYTPQYVGAITQTDQQAQAQMADDLGRTIVRRVLEGN